MTVNVGDYPVPELTILLLKHITKLIELQIKFYEFIVHTFHRVTWDPAIHTHHGAVL